MNNIEIRDIVESIGKEAFVSIFYPEVKANPNITGAEISKKYPDRKYTSWNMRTSFTKKLFDSHRCLSSRPISKTTTLYWEADYSDEKYLKSKTTESVKRDYDCNIELVKIRIDRENISDKLSVVPDPVRKALKYCSAGNNYYADDIVKELIDKNYKSYWEYAAPLYDKECEKVDPGVFGLYEAFHKRDK